MATSENYFTLVQTGSSSWAAVPQEKLATDTLEIEPVHSGNAGMFAHSVSEPSRLAEQYPRLAVALIAAAILAFSVSMEVEYLSHAGYIWH